MNFYLNISMFEGNSYVFDRLENVIT